MSAATLKLAPGAGTVRSVLHSRRKATPGRKPKPETIAKREADKKRRLSTDVCQSNVPLPERLADELRAWSESTGGQFALYVRPSDARLPAQLFANEGMELLRSPDGDVPRGLSAASAISMAATLPADLFASKAAPPANWQEQQRVADVLFLPFAQL